MQNYDTVVAAINGLKAKGYIKDLNLVFDKITSPKDNIFLHPADFEIMEIHRFEGNSDPDDEDVVYAVESKDGKIKGVVTSAFGLYADPVSAEMIKKLSTHKK